MVLILYEHNIKIVHTPVTVLDTVDEYYQYYDTFEVKLKS